MSKKKFALVMLFVLVMSLSIASMVSAGGFGSASDGLNKGSDCTPGITC